MSKHYTVVEWGIAVLIVIGNIKHNITEKVVSGYTFIKRKYYGYKFRTVEDAAKHIMEKVK